MEVEEKGLFGGAEGGVAGGEVGGAVERVTGRRGWRSGMGVEQKKRKNGSRTGAEKLGKLVSTSFSPLH